MKIKQELDQIKEDWQNGIDGNKELLAKAKRNITYWLDTEEFDEQSFRFKATELVIKMAEIEARKVPKWY